MECHVCLVEGKKKLGDCMCALAENKLGHFNKHANSAENEAHLAERQKKKNDTLKASKNKVSSFGVVYLTCSMTMCSHSFLH